MHKILAIVKPISNSYSKQQTRWALALATAWSTPSKVALIVRGTGQVEITVTICRWYAVLVTINTSIVWLAGKSNLHSKFSSPKWMVTIGSIWSNPSETEVSRPNVVMILHIFVPYFHIKNGPITRSLHQWTYATYIRTSIGILQHFEIYTWLYIISPQ